MIILTIKTNNNTRKIVEISNRIQKGTTKKMMCLNLTHITNTPKIIETQHQ
jgi:hypothetical protein